MNNNQDNFVYTPQSATTPDNQLNNMENQPVINNNPSLQKQPQQLNVVPQQENMKNLNQQNINNQDLNQPINNLNNIENINHMNPNNKMYNIYNELNQNDIDSNQTNNRINFGGVFSNQVSSIKDNMSDEDYDMINPQQDNKFINNKFDTTSTSLGDLTVDPNTPKIDYWNDKKVQENLLNDEKRKNTLTITQEAKVFIIIIVVLFLFIFVMPYIFDAIKNIG